MISHVHKTIFIHIPKCAGTSIEKAFAENLSIDWQGRIVLMMGTNDESSIGPKWLAHLKSNEYIKHNYISQEQYDDYFTFSIVRHPVSRLMSIYKYRYYDHLMSFNRFVENVLPFKFESDIFFHTQTSYLTIDGTIKVDKIGKFEELETFYCELSKKFGLSNKLPHSKNSKEYVSAIKKVYRSLRLMLREPITLKCFQIKNSGNVTVDSRTRAIMEKYYEDDFNNFCYE